MPLVFADIGKSYMIKRVGGQQETKRRLECMGFTPGEWVSVINTVDGNLIVKIKECRVAISKEMAQRIIV